MHAVRTKWTPLPSFLREDYSPYVCGVSANRENYNLHARRVHLQNLLKTWYNTGRNPFRRPVECRNCLFDTRIPNIYITPAGLCNMCDTYRRNFNGELLAAELDEFLHTPREQGAGYDAAVAFSGGKDSTASLYLAKIHFQLHVVAVLVDNGFIPQDVIANGKRFCESLGVPLVVRSIWFAPELKALADQDFRTGYPCYKCTDMFHQAILAYCRTNHINRVVLGRNWWRWLEPQVRSVRRIRDEATGSEIQLLSLPFAMQMTEDMALALLRDAGWRPVEISGNSTNCLIPGFVEYTLARRLGYHPELNLLSREVISGYLPKERARAKLQNIRDLRQQMWCAIETALAAGPPSVSESEPPR